MDKQTLREQLQDLHTELQKVESLDAGERELLQNLAKDVQEVLGQEHDQTQQYSSLGDRLREVVAQVEASHPRVTLLMRQVIDELGYMGI
jgi:septation ring formation regulator EzrA